MVNAQRKNQQNTYQKNTETIDALNSAFMNEQLQAVQLVQEAQKKTRLMPELAVSHALELDRNLRRQHIDHQITYSAAGWVSSRLREADIGASASGTRPLDTLWRAEKLRRAGTPHKASALAFQTAKLMEIPALNLLYANLSLEYETVWLHFLNKYLVHRAACDKRSQYDYFLTLRHGAGSRFARLTLARGIAAEQQDGPIVSVLMPVYNSERTLRLAAESILNQTWRAFELILIDDASTDKSLEIAYQLKQQDPRVRVLALSHNGGPYIARNIGAQQAIGSYISVHDADDWAFPTRLADQMAALRKTPEASVVMAHMLRLQDDGLVRRLQPTGWITPDGGLRLCFPSMLFDRAYFQQKLGAWESVKAGADLEMFQRIKRFDPTAILISTKLMMLQLDHPASLTSSAEMYNDERGISEWRYNYQRMWTARHQGHTAMPFLSSPQITESTSVELPTS